MAAMCLEDEKPHRGVPTRKSAPYQGQSVCNSTTALGLQSTAVVNRIGSRSTGKERDTESGNDYMFARYYNSATGRFLSPDWDAKGDDPVPYAKLDNPQSLNLYSYVYNNPLLRADPDGHCAEDACVVETAVVVAATVGAVGVYMSTPSYQRSFSTFTSAFSSEVSSGINTVRGWFSSSSSADGAKSPPNPNGSKGAPDHQATADEEAAKMGPKGQREVRIPTPGGAKGTRVADAATVEADGTVSAVTQVVRPRRNGQPPKREVQAAQDIENATKVKPKLVPVRPLPNSSSQ